MNRVVIAKYSQSWKMVGREITCRLFNAETKNDAIEVCLSAREASLRFWQR